MTAADSTSGPSASPAGSPASGAGPTPAARGDAPAPRGRRSRRTVGRRSSARWITAQAGQLVAVACAVVVLTFLIVRMIPGDPATTILGINADPNNLAALRRDFHLDRSLPEQFWLYASGLFRGDLGTSLVEAGRPVSSIIGSSLPVTLSVAGFAVVAALVVGVPVGVTPVVAGLRRTDLLVKSLMIVLIATPTFLTALALVLVVSLGLHAAPAGGWGETTAGHLAHLWLPGFALSLYLLPIVVRTVRQSAYDTWQQSFIEATISRGLAFRSIVFRHVVPNSLLPVVTLVGYNLGVLIGGAVVIDVVFDLPGLGTRLVEAVQARDYPVVQGIALVTALFVVVANTVTDLLYAVIDPRTRGRAT